MWDNCGADGCEVTMMVEWYGIGGGRLDTCERADVETAEWGSSVTHSLRWCVECGSVNTNILAV